MQPTESSRSRFGEGSASQPAGRPHSPVEAPNRSVMGPYAINGVQYLYVDGRLMGRNLSDPYRHGQPGFLDTTNASSRRTCCPNDAQMRRLQIL